MKQTIRDTFRRMLEALPWGPWRRPMAGTLALPVQVFPPGMDGFREDETVATKIHGYMPMAASSEVRSFVGALQAMDTPFPEAASQACLAFGEKAVRPVFIEAIGRDVRGKEVLDVLDVLAKTSSGAANAWLNDAMRAGCFQEWAQISPRSTSGIYLRHRAWLRYLPAGLTVAGVVDLQGCVSLTQFPVSSHVGGDLILRGCSALSRLPHDLSVGGNLDLRGCIAWDGNLPESLNPMTKVFTDRHPEGMALWAWRKRHPRGEFLEVAP